MNCLQQRMTFGQGVFFFFLRGGPRAREGVPLRETDPPSQHRGRPDCNIDQECPHRRRLFDPTW